MTTSVTRLCTDTMFTLKTATSQDIPIIEQIMAASMAEILPQFLDPKQVERSSECMGVDRLLVEDGTYFLVYDGDEPVACGGWSRRRTLFGGSHTINRDDTPADPASEPAKIRAMYTHPDHVRRGIGRLLMERCEADARAEGFTAMEMGSTAPGVPLYEACGYRIVEDVSNISEDGTRVPVYRMRKELV
ncbi:MAG: GNAT family N-acetyltransferase [Parvularcula sp.]